MPPAKKSTKKKVAAPTPVEATTHVDTRVNIPTDAQRDFVADDERAPLPVSIPRYAEDRDPSLDPQLIWNGKITQDADGLDVPAVPIYIQEKIDPRAIIENLRDTAAPGEDEPELSLFDTFDGLGGYDLVEFYEHDANWANRLVLGDSLLVMTSLAEKERMRGKVQMIYVDPPYGIKFGSNWQVSTRKRDVKDGKAEDVTRQPEQIKAFRDTWELGIHSYLSYLRDRFTVARELLTETGSIFVQIGDENVHLVRSVMDEVFGSENFVSLITFKKTAGATGDRLAGTADYLIWYARGIDRVKYRQLLREREVGGVGGGAYSSVELVDGERRRLTPEEQRDLSLLPDGARVFRLQILTSQSMGRTKGEGAASWFPVEIGGREYRPSMQARWKTNEPGMANLVATGRVHPSGSSISYVRYHNDFPAFPITNFWDDTQTGSGMDKTYVVQTNSKVIERCMLMTTDPGDLVLDPTCGAGTTAYVAEQWGRRWITVDTSRVALALARTRLMAAKFPYYLLADSEAGASQEQKLTGVKPDGPFTNDIKRGFVCKRVPHITLKSIAQNPDITEGMTREQIDAAIARHADTELLVDQPYQDNKTVRVSGRFTVESLSPHRTLEAPDPSIGVPAQTDGVAFETMILDNLRKAGVQNTFRNERLTFDRLDPLANAWIQGEGEFTDADGTTRRVAVAIGPEHGTVSPDQVKEAAREALKGQGFDLLVMGGFAFDASAGERAKEFAPSTDGFAEAAEERKLGRLRVLLARVNPDLAMGDELLKKTGSGNLFMVFGEPDVELRRLENDQLEVEIHGVDVYDPTTGQVRSSSTDDIACWLVDTNYDDTSFFVRHAYFTGGQRPYESLAKTLRADIDESAWATLYSTISRPFLVPATGKIAVKVINHYGDEVMQVYGV
jgi:adenine-specific DNA-methyltransferase